MDINKLKFDNNTFDVITARHTILNVNEIKRVLKPNGIVIIEGVAKDDSYELKENWDLDSLDSFGNKKSDLLVMRFRAAKFLYGGLEWGYKENESSS